MKTLVVALALAFAAPAQAQLAALKPQLEKRIAQHKGAVALSLIDLSTGEKLSIRGDEPFPSASVIKLPILVELFHQIQKGPLKLSDPVVMLASDQRPGSGILQFFSTPHQMTVGDVATLMIIMSDNTATNFIIDKVGIRNVNARMDSLGLKTTRLHAKVFLGSSTTIDTTATRVWGFGVTTANDIAEILSRLYRGQIVSDSVSRQIVDIMKKNFDDLGIPRYLKDVTVANKTGALNASRHDCGIVYGKPRDFVLCILTKDNQDQSWFLDTEAYVTIGDLARMVQAYFVGLK